MLYGINRTRNLFSFFPFFCLIYPESFTRVVVVVCLFVVAIGQSKHFNLDLVNRVSHRSWINELHYLLSCIYCSIILFSEMFSFSLSTAVTGSALRVKRIVKLIFLFSFTHSLTEHTARDQIVWKKLKKVSLVRKIHLMTKSTKVSYNLAPFDIGWNHPTSDIERNNWTRLL